MEKIEFQNKVNAGFSAGESDLEISNLEQFLTY